MSVEVRIKPRMSGLGERKKITGRSARCVVFGNDEAWISPI